GEALEAATELGTVFVDEAQETFQLVADGILETGDRNRSAAERDECLGRLGLLFHRLKGSAVLAGEAGVAEQAGALLDLCESDAPPERALEEINRGFARLRRLLGGGAAHEPEPVADAAPAPPAAASGPVREAVRVEGDASLWEAFEAEAADLLERIDRSLFALEE